MDEPYVFVNARLVIMIVQRTIYMFRIVFKYEYFIVYAGLRPRGSIFWNGIFTAPPNMCVSIGLAICPLTIQFFGRRSANPSIILSILATTLISLTLLLSLPFTSSPFIHSFIQNNKSIPPCPKDPPSTSTT